ncbi:targeting protein for Xklp2 homolog [Glandiceps talaboti]
MSAPVDGDWDYNAPQFVDFSEATATEFYDDGADSYFNFDHENGIPVRFSVINGKRVSVAVAPNPNNGSTSNTIDTETLPSDKNTEANLDTVEETSMEDEKTEPVVEEPQQPASEDSEEIVNAVKVPKNIVKTFTAWKAKHTSGNETTTSGVASTENKKMMRQRARQQHLKNTDKKVSTTTQIQNGVRGTRCSPRVKAQSQTIRRETRSLDGPATKRSRTEANKKIESSKMKKLKLTLPSTPTCLKRVGVKPGASFKSSEELEMEKIAKLRHQLVERRRVAEESMKKSQTSSGHAPVRSERTCTHVEEFHFATDDRLKSHSMTTRSDAKERDFKSSLRSHPPSPHNPRKGPTKAMPFHFNERKRKISETQDEPVYKPMAVLVNEFQSKTPDRFRQKPRSRGNTPQMGKRKPCSKLTIAKTPLLETRHRKRSYTVASAQDKEDQEVEEMKQYKFKAKPVNPHLFTDKVVLPKKTAKKKCTEPVGFEFETRSRNEVRDASKPKEENKFEFHARPVPAKILERPMGVGEKKTIPVTCPKSPAFALKNRVRIQKEDESFKDEREKPVKFSRPAPQPGIIFKPVIDHKHTEIQPFTFDDRDKERMAKKEEKIQQVFMEEKKAREFRAQTLPSPSLKGLPVKKPKEVTRPAPFQLRVEERGTIAADEWARKMEEELKNQRAQANAFKARPTKVLYEEPFIPVTGQRPLTDMAPFQLNTDKRAHQREDFENFKKKKECDLAEEKLNREKEIMTMEKEAVRQLRNDMVHKPNPIRHFKEIQVIPSTVPLTAPISPQLRTSRRRTDRL